MGHAKETLGRVAALQGNVPLSLIQTGAPAEVREYCRKLIEIAAPGGGFLLDTGAAMQQGNDENIHAMIRAARDFGAY
jgi:uroporphyrinogen-III decarboxylase